MNEPTTQIVRDESGLNVMAALIVVDSLPIGFDTETSGPSIVWQKKSRPDPYRAKLTGFSVYHNGARWYVPVDHAEGGNVPEDAARRFLQRLMDLARAGRRVWAHNWKFDLQILRNFGVTYGPYSDHLFCSQVAAWLAGFGADHDSLKLKSLAVAHGFGAGDTFAEVAKKRQARDIPVEEIAPYAGRDAYLTVALGELAWTVLEKYDLVEHYQKRDMPLVEILRGVEEWGTPTDVAALEQLREELVTETDALREEFRALTETVVTVPVKERVHEGEFFKNGNPKLVTKLVPREFVIGADVSSDNQVSRWCYEELKVWPLKVREVKGGPLAQLVKNGANHYPTDKETVEKWAALPDPLARRLAEIRLEFGLKNKLIGTYLKPMLELPKQWGDGRLHCSYNLTGTETQRFSSSNPNLQNVPSRTEEGQRIRRALLSPEGWDTIVLDYSQIELRIAAHLSQDENMLAAYLFEEDIHQHTLDALLQLWSEAKRTDAKVTNFSTVYRISAPSLAVKMRSSEEAAEKSIEAFYQKYPGIARYHRQAIAFAAKHGYAQTIDGFKRVLDVTPQYNRRTGKKEIPWKTANKAINTPIQGSAGGLAKISMINAHRDWTERGEYVTRVIFAGQEHDSLIANSRKDFTEQALVDLKRHMESAWTLRVPLVADGGAGPNWKAAKEAA